MDRTVSTQMVDFGPAIRQGYLIIELENHVQISMCPKLRLFFTMSVIVTATAGRSAAGEPQSPSPTGHHQLGANCSISLRGTALGGTVTLSPLNIAQVPYVEVATLAGEPASTLIQRLAEALGKCEPCQAECFPGNCVVLVKPDQILLRKGGMQGFPNWVLGGSDLGFDIPKPPVAVSVNETTNGIAMRWINAETDYDAIRILLNGESLQKLSGSASEWVCDPQRDPGVGFWRSGHGKASSIVYFWLVAYRKGTPSNGVGVRLGGNNGEKGVQETFLTVPFTAGVAPGFESWQQCDTAKKVILQQRNHPLMKPAASPRQDAFIGVQPFAQSLTGRGDCRGGVVRRFIGLPSGHTYRVSTRVRVVETSGSNWLFSVHAAAHRPAHPNLSAAQLAGIETLPDGDSGPKAGQIARFDATTQAGDWVTRSSGETARDDSGGDVVLPPGADSLTVWFRLEVGGDSQATVAVDLVRLEDLGPRR
jgi:hypothetical protein